MIPLFLMFMTVNLFGQSPDFDSYDIGEEHRLYSNILNEEREIFVYVPSGFWGMDTNVESYPVTYVLDGESQFLTTVSAIDFLSSAPMGNDKMPQTIVVGIPNTNRTRDLTPTKGIVGGDSSTIDLTGGGVAFLEFITTELSPFIDSLYATNSHRTIIGHSMGGLIVFEALLNKRDFFDNYLAIDTGLDFDNGSYYNQVIDTLRKANLSEEKLFIAKANSIPTFLDISNIEEDTSELVKLTKTNQQFLELANSENWNVNILYQDFPNEDHFSVPYPATYEGMKFLYSYYPFKQMMDYYHPSYQDKTDLVDQLKKHYQNISTQLTYEVIPMESYLNSWAYGFDYFKRPDLAIDLFDYNIELYPNNPSVYTSKGYFMLNQENNKAAIELFEKSLLLEDNLDIRTLLVELKY